MIHSWEPNYDPMPTWVAGVKQILSHQGMIHVFIRSGHNLNIFEDKTNGLLGYFSSSTLDIFGPDMLRLLRTDLYPRATRSST